MKLINAYNAALKDLGIPRSIKSRKFAYHFKLLKDIIGEDDPYTYFRVLIEAGFLWPSEMTSQEAISYYNQWKIKRQAQGLPIKIKRNSAKMEDEVKKAESEFLGFEGDFKEFVLRKKPSPYWVALREEWKDFRDELPYPYFKKIRQAYLWLRKHPARKNYLKSLISTKTS